MNHLTLLCLDDIGSLEKYIQEELNIRQVTLSADKASYGVTLRAEPDHKTLGPRLGGAFKSVMADIKKVKMKMGVQLLVNDPAELEKMRDRESDITKERINKILATGANVILTTGGIDDLCLKYFVEAGAMAVRRCKRQDLKRIARPQVLPL